MMKLMTFAQYSRMSKPVLIKKIVRGLKLMSKEKLAKILFDVTRSNLPRLKKTVKVDGRSVTYDVFPYQMTKTERDKFYKKKQKALPKPKTKRKFSRKQLAAQRLFAKRARAGTLRRR